MNRVIDLIITEILNYLNKDFKKLDFIKNIG